MKRNDIICMAHEQGLPETATEGVFIVNSDDLGRLLAAEREAIAQSLDKQADLACDEIDKQWAQEMAAAVRARSNT